MFEEKREYPRALTDLRLYISSPQIGGFFCPTRDMSAKGINIETPEQMVEGSEFEIEINLDDLEETIKARGRVVRSWLDGNQWLAGIELLGMDYSDFLEMYNFTLEKIDQEKEN